MSLSEVISQDETGYLIEKRKYLHSHPLSPKFPFLEKYDKNLNLIKSVDLSKYSLPGKPLFRKVLAWDNRLWLFYTTNPGDTKEAGLYRVAINPADFTLEGESHLVLASMKGNVKKVIRTTSVGSLKESVPTFHIYPDKTVGKLLVVYQAPTAKKKEISLSFVVMDDQFTPLLNKRTAIPALSDNLVIKDVVLDSNWNVHLLSAESINTSAVPYRKQAVFTLLSFPFRGGEVRHKPLDLGENHLIQARIKADQEGHLVVGGFYSRQTYDKRTGGTYLLKMEGNAQKTIHEVVDPFDEGFLTSGLTDGQAKKVVKKVANGRRLEDSMYHLDEILFKDDGSVILVGEERAAFRISNATSIKTGNVLGSISIVEFDAEVNRKWSKKVVKHQRSSSVAAYYFSYSIDLIDNNLLFIFNDHKKNLSYEGQGSVEEYDPNTAKTHLIMLIKVDERGNMIRKSLSLAEDQRLKTLPRVNRQVGAHEILIYGEHRKNYRLGKLVFDPGMMATE
jgi:hypothetical protein